MNPLLNSGTVCSALKALFVATRFFLPLLPLVVSTLNLKAQINYVSPYTITTFAGRSPSGDDNGIGSDARFRGLWGVTVDGMHNVFVADTESHTIRKITVGGVVTTFAGAAGVSGSTDGAGSDARFASPSGVAADVDGNIYIADTANSTIRKISSGGMVTTIAGKPGINGSIDGSGLMARFANPFGLAVAKSGNLYVADTGNNTVRKITPAGVVTTLAGLAGSSGSSDGAGSSARFSFPMGLAVDSFENVYVVCDGNTVRKITESGTVTTLAGLTGSSGVADGVGNAARFGRSLGLAVDGSGNVYVADTENSRLRRITPDGTVTTFADDAGANRWADINGAALVVTLNYPTGVALDDAGDLYVAERYSYSVRKITAAGVTTTLAGLPSSAGSADGYGGAARFNLPQGIAMGKSGNIYIADSGNHTVRKISPSGETTTLAGIAGVPGANDGVGSMARFNNPRGIAVDGLENIYVGDGNQTIRKITSAGTVSTVAQLSANARSLAADTAGNVYFTDFASTVRKMNSGGVVTTLAGLAFNTGSSDGLGSVARFNNPIGIAVDGADNLFVVDSGNSTIRKITPDGMVTTIAGAAGFIYNVDGMGGAARFWSPVAVAVDRAGYLFVTTSAGSLIRRITPTGIVTTLAGGRFGSLDGTGIKAQFGAMSGVAVSASGNLYIVDAENNTIRKGVATDGVPALGDFDGDRQHDLIWSNLVTGERSMWFLSGGPTSGGATLGVVPTAWTVSAVGDFDGDGKADICWTNVVTGDRTIWLMDRSTIRTNAFMGTVSLDWAISAAGDFNGDGKIDLVWTNASTGDRAMWLMNGSAVLGGGYLGKVATEWTISGSGDFNGDGKADLVWTNTATGERAMWFMNGSTQTAGATLGTIPADWAIAGVGDFNGDGKADIFLSNTTTGDRVIWLMNGSTIVTNAFMGTIPVEWSVSGTGDFNADGKKDLFWTNTMTGDRAMWLLNGSTVLGGGFMGTVPVIWKIN